MSSHYHRWLALLATLALLGFGTGCPDDSEDTGDADGSVDEEESHVDGGEDEELELPDVDCDGADVPTYADVAAFDTCTNCHSSERTGDMRNDAPDDDNFDTYEAAAEIADEAAHEVYEGEMPPDGSGFSLTEDEKQDLYLWALCGTPE